MNLVNANIIGITGLLILTPFAFYFNFRRVNNKFFFLIYMAPHKQKLTTTVW